MYMEKNREFSFSAKIWINMIFKHSIGVMIISWVIIKGLEQEFFLFPFVQLKQIYSPLDDCSLDTDLCRHFLKN